jgi:hypothetical protein
MKKLLIVLTTALLSSCYDSSLLEETNIKGCTNPQSVNYNPNAYIDDGSCVFVEKKQNSIFGKFTATWCGPCGNWGGPAFTNFHQQNSGDVLGISLQVNDNFTTSENGPLVDEFATKWQYTGTPNFFANETFVGTSVNQLQSIVDSKNSESPKLAIGVHKTIGAGKNAGKYNINVYIKAYENLSGQYNLSVLYLHKDIVASQNTGSGYDNGYIHHHVLIKSAIPYGAFGEPIFNGMDSGEVYRWSKVIDYDENWDLEKIELVFIVWKNTGSGYEFINSTTN